MGQLANLYPTQPTGRLVLDLDRGAFAFTPKTPADALNFEWINTVTSKDASGRVSVIGVVAGKVGFVNENGEGLICRGEEKTSPFAKPSLMENGRFTMRKVRSQARQNAIDECLAEGGSVVLENGDVAVLHAHCQASQPVAVQFNSARAANAHKCFSSEVQVKCDLSVHAAAMSELYKKFRAENPAHSVANDEVFDALR